MKIGVISDTHGHFDPRLPEIFAGVDHILHAGDVGHYSVLNDLGRIAPLTVVLGNNDFGMDLSETEVVSLAGLKFLVHHIVAPTALPPELARRIEREAPDVVVFGHTHQPFARQLGRTLFFNPGYAGKPRFSLERSVALFEVHDGRLEHRQVALPRLEAR